MNWKLAVRKSFWSLGLDLVKDQPDNSLPSYMRMLFRDLKIRCVLDVGGHRGEFATGLRTFGYDGRIISFEPVKRNFEHIQRAAANDPLWDVHNVALGSVDSEAEINVTEGTVFSSFLDPVREKVLARETVIVRRLDGILAELVPGEENVFLKMDTQGFDLEVMRGTSSVQDRIPAILTEMSVVPVYEQSPPFTEAMAELKAMGYHPSAMYPVHRHGLKLVEFDCVLVR